MLAFRVLQLNVLIVAFVGPGTFVYGLSEDGAAAESELLRSISALRGILRYFANNYKEVNLDAVIGTRMVDGEYSWLALV